MSDVMRRDLALPAFILTLFTTLAFSGGSSAGKVTIKELGVIPVGIYLNDPGSILGTATGEKLKPKHDEEGAVRPGFGRDRTLDVVVELDFDAPKDNHVQLVLFTLDDNRIGMGMHPFKPHPIKGNKLPEIKKGKKVSEPVQIDLKDLKKDTFLVATAIGYDKALTDPKPASRVWKILGP